MAIKKVKIETGSEEFYLRAYSFLQGEHSINFDVLGIALIDVVVDRNSTLKAMADEIGWTRHKLRRNFEKLGYVQDPHDVKKKISLLRKKVSCIQPLTTFSQPRTQVNPNTTLLQSCNRAKNCTLELKRLNYPYEFNVSDILETRDLTQVEYNSNYQVTLCRIGSNCKVILKITLNTIEDIEVSVLTPRGEFDSQDISVMQETLHVAGILCKQCKGIQD